MELSREIVEQCCSARREGESWLEITLFVNRAMNLTASPETVRKSVDYWMRKYFDEYEHRTDVLDDIIDLREQKLAWDAIVSEIFDTYEISLLPTFIKHLYYIHRQDENDQQDMVASLASKRKFQTKNNELRRNEYRLLDAHNRVEEFRNEIHMLSKSLVQDVVDAFYLPVISSAPIQSSIVGVLSDTHLGLNVSPEEVGGVNQFNSKVAAARLSEFASHLIKYKRNNRSNQECVLILNGDLIQGVIHDSKNQELLTIQYAMALRYFTQFICVIAKNYPTVRVIYQGGNHGRVMHKLNKGRQTEEKWDSYETMLMYAIKLGFANTNVTVHIDEAPYSITDIQGHSFLVTHGDTVVNVGNPSKKIGTDQITAKVNALNIARHRDGVPPISGVILGHVHFPAYFVAENGVHYLVNSSLSGVDPFANQLGIFDSTPIQLMFEVVQEVPVGDVRFVHLNNPVNCEYITPFTPEHIFGV